MIKSSDPGLADRFIVLALHKVSRWERMPKKYPSFRENDDIEGDFEQETEGVGNNYAPAVKVLRTERQAGNDQGGGAGRASQEFRQKSI